MTSLAQATRTEIDQYVLLRGVTWEDYERLLAVRGESSVPRMTYLDGELELMSPSTSHEWRKTLIARLLEAWAEESDIDLNGYGSWTVRKKPRKRGLEPDECYILGTRKKPRPDLAIEVVISSGNLDKLDVYSGLGVPEVWFWQRDTIEIHVLRGKGYEKVARSELLPTLDFALPSRFVDHPQQTQAVREYRAALRAAGSRG